MWTSRKQFKKCAPCTFKVCTFFSHTKKKRAHQYTTNHKNGTKKTKQKKIVPTSNIITKKKTTLLCETERHFSLCWSLSLPTPTMRRIVGVSQADENIDEANEMLMTSSANRRRGGGGSSSTASATTRIP